MRNLALEVKALKNGFKYTVKDGETVIDTRKSGRSYVAASVFFSKNSNTYVALYHGRPDLIGGGSCNDYMKSSLYEYVGVARLKE